MVKTIRLTRPQLEYVSSPATHPLFVGGYGSGKTYANIMRALSCKLQYPALSVAYYLPTYDLIRTIGFPRFCLALEELGIKYLLNKADATIAIAGAGTIIFRTMDTPERIIGFEVADSFVDELDTLPTDKARDVWARIVARNRQKKPDGAPNTIGTATTPEGFKFTYAMWVQSPKPGYAVIKAATASNKHLPPDYIDSLKAIYPSNLLQAYLMGEFVNLSAGSIYAEFDRDRHHTNAVMNETEPLHIGMDFNVSKMSAVVWILRDKHPCAVDELTGILDTPSMIDTINRRYPGHTIMIYPDASGQSRKSNNASQSDISLLRQAGFAVCVNPSNPAVKDRILATNKKISDDTLMVNTDRCPMLTEALEKQCYDKNGEPDKASGFDHIIDAATYFIAYKFPIKRRSAIITEMRL